MSTPLKSRTSLLIIIVPMGVLALIGLALIISAPVDSLWRDGAIQNNRLAAGIGVLVAFAWSLVKALSRLAERMMD